MCRTYESEDAAALEQLLNQLGYCLSAAAIEKNVAAIRNRAGEVFVKDLDGRVVGCVNAVLDSRLAEGTHGEIATLVVLDGYRGHGIGRELVTHAERWLAGRVGSMRVRANAIRSRAHRFYQQLGYRETKTQKVFFKEIRQRDNHSAGRERG